MIAVTSCSRLISVLFQEWTSSVDHWPSAAFFCSSLSLSLTFKAHSRLPFRFNQRLIQRMNDWAKCLSLACDISGSQSLPFILFLSLLTFKARSECRRHYREHRVFFFCLFFFIMSSLLFKAFFKVCFYFCRLWLNSWKYSNILLILLN